MNKSYNWLLGLLFLALSNAPGRAQTISTVKPTGLWRGGIDGPSQANLTVSGNALYFVAGEPVGNAELWRTDGTAGGTRQVIDLNPNGGSIPTELTDVNGTLFFTANDKRELYRTDGTVNGTVFIRSFPDVIDGFRAINGRLYFRADLDLWRTDGTAAGTFRVTNLRNPNYQLVPYAGKLYLAVASGQAFRFTSLYQVNDAPNGAQFITELPGFLQSITAGPDGLYFTLLDPNTNAYTAYRNDGTSGGTTVLPPARPGSSQTFFTKNNELYSQENRSSASNYPTVNLRKYNRQTGTFDAAQPDSPLFIPENAVLYRDQLYCLNADPAYRQELRRQDGTPVVDLNPGPANGAGYQLFLFNDLLYFGGRTATSGYELYQSDGTAAGTRLTQALGSNPRFLGPDELTPFRNELYFTFSKPNNQFDAGLYKLTPGPNTTPLPAGFAITGVTTVSCQTVTATERRVTLMPQYAGLNGQPVTFSVLYETLPTTNAGPYTVRLYVDNPGVTLRAEQSGTVATYRYNWLAFCANGGRWSAEPTEPLRVRVLGNPVAGETLDVDVRGAAGQWLRLQASDLNGQTVAEIIIEQAAAEERATLRLNRPAGLYFLRAATPTQQEVIKVVKQ